jgi:epoxide hydrolase
MSRGLGQCGGMATDRRAIPTIQTHGPVPQYRTKIDGLGIHFLHVRSKHPDALPIILTHGWPGSVVEFLKVVRPLTDPTAHGGKAEDAFHVVVPSLPGYGFSDKPAERGWGLPRIARAWSVLMRRLGYTDYLAQGGDWGAGVTTWMAKQHVEGLAAIHLNLPILFPPPVEGEPNQAEKATIAQLVAFNDKKSVCPTTTLTPPHRHIELRDSASGVQQFEPCRRQHLEPVRLELSEAEFTRMVDRLRGAMAGFCRSDWGQSAA